MPDIPMAVGGSLVTLSDLASYPIWVAWREEPREDGGKPTKVPYSPANYRAAVDKPNTWSTLDEAKTLEPRSGLGVMLTALGDNSNLCGIDFDGCVHTDGSIASWARQIIDMLDTYAEYSPSGAGIKSFFRLTDDGVTHFVGLIDGFAASWPQEPEGEIAGDRSAKIELHPMRRFYTTTGECLPDTPEYVRAIPWEELEIIIHSLGPLKKRERGQPAGDLKPIDDGELAKKVEAAKKASPQLAARLRGEFPEEKGKKVDRSARVYKIITLLKLHGFDFSESVVILDYCPATESWMHDKGRANDYREVRNIWEAIAREPKEKAEEEFVAAPEPPPEKKSRPLDARRPGQSMSDVINSEWSDVFVAEHIIHYGGLGQVMAWRSDLDRWLLWDNAIRGWRNDTEQATGAERMIVDKIRDYAAQRGNDWTRGIKTTMMSVSKLRAVRHMMALNLEPKNIESSTYHLQTLAGTYDLRTCSLIPDNDAKRKFTGRYTGVTPVFDKPTPYFDALLANLAEDNAEVIEWMWHWFGYCALGEPRADCFVVLWGPGGNGKSVLNFVLEHALGDYYVALDRRVLMERGRKLHDTSLFQLKEKRFAVVSELESKDSWDEGLLKQITGGDMIGARDMRQSASTFRCEAGLLVTCNELPTFSKVTPAILRRFRMIGTVRRPEVPDTALKYRIVQEELGAVLGKIIRYAQKVFNPHGGLYDHVKLPPTPAAMSAEAQTFLADSDPFFAWLSAECEYGVSVKDEFESIPMLKARFDSFNSRSAGPMAMVGDGINEREFREALRRVGCALKDEKGHQLRKTMFNNSGIREQVTVARGIKLKVKLADVG